MASKILQLLLTFIFLALFGVSLWEKQFAKALYWWSATGINLSVMWMKGA